MAMGGNKLKRIDDRLDALVAGLGAALSTRTVERGFVHFDDRSPADLRNGGFVNVVSAGEGQYSTARGMAAQEGTLKAHLICHLAVDETATRDDLQQAEINLMEEIKAFVRAGLPGMTLTLESLEQSRLLNFPIGWVVAFVELHPPASSTH